MNSQAAQSAIIQTRLRLNDCFDWLEKHKLPSDWSLTTYADQYGSRLAINLRFESYKAANAWAWLGCRFAEDSKYGYHSRTVLSTFITVPLPDFDLWLNFPSETHPDALNPELAHLS